MSKKFTKEKFIEKSIRFHGERYNYSLVEYKNDLTKVSIICDLHGIFQQSPNTHYRSGCPDCGLLKRSISRKNTIEELIRNFTIRHGDKYDYSNVKYDRMKDKIEIRCKKHDFLFLQTPEKHLNSISGGCKKCNSIGKGFLSVDEFVSKSMMIHGEKYNYDKTIYLNSSSKIKIECSKHGVFEMRPNSHLMGRGCPSCNRNGSILENKWLDSHKIDQKNRQVKLAGYYVDGIDEETKTVYEFYGDFWHGNLDKYDTNDINSVNKLTFGQLYQKTIDRERVLESLGYKIVSIWESEYKKIFKNNDR